MYKIKRQNNPNNALNDLYAIRCQQGSDEKVLRLETDGGTCTLNSMTNEFPIQSLHLAADCFRIGKTINQFRHLC